MLLFGVVACQTKPAQVAPRSDQVLRASREQALESAEHRFAQQNYNEATSRLRKLDEQIASLKNEAALQLQPCKIPDPPLGAEYEAYSDCLDRQEPRCVSGRG